MLLRARLHRGISYLEVGQYKKALEDFDVSLEKKSSFEK